MKNTNEKTSKQNANSDRLIARMVLGLGLSLTIASAVVAGITHPRFSDVRDEYLEAVNEKADYLDTYEQTDEFKTAYNADVNALNNRLIAREIDAHTYESELEKLNDNNYTEKVIVETSDVQTQAKLTEINQKMSTTSHEFDKYAIPCAVTALTSFMLPVVSIYNYSMFNAHEKDNDKDQIEPDLHVSQESVKRIMEIDTTPYHGGNYHPISAEETKKYISHCPTIEQENPGKRINIKFEYNEAYDTMDIVTEEENQRTL